LQLRITGVAIAPRCRGGFGWVYFLKPQNDVGLWMARALLKTSPSEGTSFMIYMRTIRQEVRCTGIGLHTGKQVTLALKPAPPRHGVVFRRRDLGGAEVPASRDSLASINYATTLSRDGVTVSTTEHLLSAVYALGIDDLVVELDGPELPIMDGSASPFVYLLHEAGIRTQNEPRRFLRIRKPIFVGRDDKSMAIYPADHFRLSYTIRLNHPLVGYQTATFDVTPDTYASEIAAARTFCFLKDVEALRKKGLALGGSLDNAVVLDDLSILNDKLRFADEFVRHKILDAIGDLALLGLPVLGHVVAYRAGHALHSELVARILSTPEASVFETAADRSTRVAAPQHFSPRTA
jgi:UDP-3-O-[3-hydroxymyristoyl] N-acetylglucosamine deacetylase